LAAAKSWYLGKVLTTLGELALEDGRTEEAERRFAEAFAHARGFDARLYAVLALHGLGRVALERRDFRRAATLCAAALAMRDATGWQLRADERRRADRDIERLRAALPEGPFDHAWRLGLDLDLDAASVLLASPTDPAVRTDDGLVDALTPREREIATLVAEGLTNPQIAERLAIAPGTVRIHVERILGKLGLTSRVQVATWVVRSEAVAQQAEPA